MIGKQEQIEALSERNKAGSVQLKKFLKKISFRRFRLSFFQEGEQNAPILRILLPLTGKKPFEEFLSETSEWHALWMGFYHSWTHLRRKKLPKGLEKDIQQEYHYYTLGFFSGRIIQSFLTLLGITSTTIWVMVWIANLHP